ncbi:hypothetical protein Ancab_011791 [Ancistrocladus abbreviatus]
MALIENLLMSPPFSGNQAKNSKSQQHDLYANAMQHHLIVHSLIVIGFSSIHVNETKPAITKAATPLPLRPPLPARTLPASPSPLSVTLTTAFNLANPLPFPIFVTVSNQYSASIPITAAQAPPIFFSRWSLLSTSVDAEVDDNIIDFFSSEIEGKDITELIACGIEKLASVPAGGGGVAVAAAAASIGGAAAGGAAAPTVELKKEEKVEEKKESDRDMDCSFFD